MIRDELNKLSPIQPRLHQTLIMQKSYKCPVYIQIKPADSLSDFTDAVDLQKVIKSSSLQ